MHTETSIFTLPDRKVFLGMLPDNDCIYSLLKDDWEGI